MARRKETCIPRLLELGFNWDDAHALRRISMTLQRWFELECGDSDNYKSYAIERDDETDKPFMVIHPHGNGIGNPKSSRYPVADRENGARKRLAKLMNKYPILVPYIQTDPRGASIYILRRDDIPQGASIDSCYNRGVAVYR